MDSFVGLFNPDTQDEPLVSSSASSVSPLPEVLPPEAAEGNIEYKLKLVNPSKSRFEHLVTQMKWRLKEGQGEAIYAIGVTDGGMLIGLSQEEMNESLRTLYRMAEKLGADVTTLRERRVIGKTGINMAGEFLIRKVPDDQQSIELRVAVLGNCDVGKSTLLGVLTQGEMDSGHGSARLNLFRHLHEIQSGRTSSISHEILGFDSQGCAKTYSTCRTAEEICEASTKLITFIDLAGHQKYLKTTMFGLTGCCPHFALLVISAVSGVSGTTKEHLDLAMNVEIPVVIVINKADIASQTSLQRTVSQIEALLKSPNCSKIPHHVTSCDDAITAASSLVIEKVAPVFLTSCVTGKGLDLLYTFLNVLPPTIGVKEKEKLTELEPEFQIDEVFSVPDVGIVVSGLLTRGMIREGDKLCIGPCEKGDFSEVKVISLYRHKVPSRTVRACETATIALSYNSNIRLRKGMVLRSLKGQPAICYFFEAEIHVLFHSSTITPGFQGTVYIGNVRQTARVDGIVGKCSLGVNETSSVIFQFMQRPECINPGTKLLFRMGETKAIGYVTGIFCARDFLRSYKKAI